MRTLTMLFAMLVVLLTSTACANSSREEISGEASYLPSGDEALLADERLEACALILGIPVPLEECLGDTLPEFFTYIVDYRPCDAFFLPSYGREDDEGFWTDEDYFFFAQVVLINRSVFDDGSVSQEEVRQMALPRAQLELCESFQI